MVLTQWFNLGLSVSLVKKLLSTSLFVTRGPFVAPKLILSNSLCMTTWFKLVFSEMPLCKYCFIYTCALFCHFLGQFSPKKDNIQENKVFSRWNMTSGCYLQLQFSQFNSFSEVRANLILSLNLQSIQLFLQVYY